MSLSELTDAELLAVAVPIMDNLMDASTQMDHERHVRDFTQRARSMATKDQFQRIAKELQRSNGDFDKRDLIGILRRPHSVVVVWKQSFTKAPGEYLAELVLVEQEGRALVERVVVV